MDNNEIAEMLQNLISNMNSNNDNSNNTENSTDNSSGQENNNFQNDDNQFNFDFDTIMKMKSIMDTYNSAKNSPEANLLLSLKPYLNNNRKQKLDQYMQFLNISKIIEAFNSNGGVGKQNDS